MVLDENIEKFLADLESADSTPGAGSTAALVGALSTALTKMVCNTTLRKANTEKVVAYLKKLDDLKKDLEDLIKSDIKAYQGVAAAYQKDDQQLMNERLIVATDVPLEIMEKVLEVLEIMVKLMELINHAALGELGAAVFLAQSVLDSLELIIEINLKLIDDKEYSHATAKLATDRLETGRRLKDKALTELKRRQQ